MNPVFEAALLAMAAAAVVVVLSPLDVTFAVERAEAFRATIGVRWIFIRWSTDLRKGEGRTRTGKRQRKVSRSGFRQAVRIFQAVPFGAVQAFLERLRRAVRWRGIHGEVRFGTGDPADTGRLWGILSPLLSWIDHAVSPGVTVTPNFIEPGITGALAGTVRVYPSLAVWALFRLLTSPTTLRCGAAVFRERRSG